MSIGFVFWLLMILWLVLGLYTTRGIYKDGNYAPLGGNLLLFVLLFLLGCRAFGFPIQG